MQDKNPLFSCLTNINLVTDHEAPRMVIDSVIDGIKLGCAFMFETWPKINIKYLEDYNLTHEQIAKVPKRKRTQAFEIFNKIDTNVYISPWVDVQASGTFNISFPTYPAIRMIDIHANNIRLIIRLMGQNIGPIAPNIKNTIIYVTAHEMLHMHPIYSTTHTHCSDPDCIMFRFFDVDEIYTYPTLCPKCIKKLERFTYDMKFRRKITNLAIYRKIYHIIIKHYYGRYKDAKADSLPGIKTANATSRKVMEFIKLYYRELWLSQYK